ncbi:MAG: lipopolysaccharide assembly protein LapB [Gammaproteobacteria bacterium]|nr:lipopolysaccharide assembly protein LapB [Gammaproteobacteria bacterium]
MYELIWLLLPIAAASGWIAAKRNNTSNTKPCFDISSDYFKGLNYLLNEQPDKAIEVFLRMAEVDNDTAETHLALGSLFRKRGEVDRAIRIHQNLIARPTLSNEQKLVALVELGQDYMKAGLLDRAENIFQDLLENNPRACNALVHLIDIYQQEQDWEKAIDISKKYEVVSGKKRGHIIAHYCCEMGEKALHEGDQQQLNECLKQALVYDKNCVRANIMLAKREKKSGNCNEAIKYFEKVIDIDVDYLPEIIPHLQECFINMNKPDAMALLLESISSAGHYDGITPLLYQADILLNKGEAKRAMQLMVDQLKQRSSVRGLKWLVEHNLKRSEGRAHENLTILKDLIDNLLKDKPVYECHECGFHGKSMHWQCPGCKKWNSVKPIKGIEAE